jgi:hypothetical protein
VKAAREGRLTFLSCQRYEPLSSPNASKSTFFEQMKQF